MPAYTIGSVSFKSHSGYSLSPFRIGSAFRKVGGGTAQDRPRAREGEGGGEEGRDKKEISWLERRKERKGGATQRETDGKRE